MKLFPKVAVLLATYNGQAYVREQVDSILAQKFVDVTLYVSDDLSTDSTLEILQNYHKENIIFLPREKKFGGAGPNFYRLINDVNFDGFDFVALSDQDDIWNLDKLSVAVDILNSNSMDGYSSNVMAFWPEGTTKLVNKSQKQKQYDFLFQSAGPGCTYVLKNKLANELKSCTSQNIIALQDVVFHDWFIYAFARAKGFKWFIDPNPSMLYRQHSSNQVGMNSGWKAMKYRLMQIYAGNGLSNSLLISKIIGLENSEFVKSWSKLNKISLFKLSLHGFECRRKLEEQIIFVFICWFLILFKW